MVEVLVIFGLIGWALLVTAEWLSRLPVFPGLVLSAILLPILMIRRYRCLVTRWRLQAVLQHREPLPPERFYWGACLSDLKLQIFAWTAVSVSAWWNAVTLPAECSDKPASIVGWLNILVGTLALGRAAAALLLLIRASQRFDAMQPNLIGLARRAMYRLSDNYEYLGQKNQPRDKEELY